MNIEVRFLGLKSSNALREHVLRRIRSQLSHFGKEVTAVLVRIADINGPKGGVDKRCQVTVRGPRLGSATLNDLSGDAYSAADLAIERISRSVRRELDRVRSPRRRGHTLREAL
jgi:ribosome-associated translation inhibitor RaiA